MFDPIDESIPENTAVPVERAALICAGIVPPAFTRDKALIDCKWQERCADNPHLFNGTVFLQADLRLRAGVLSGAAVEIDYASFLHWRGNPPFQLETALYHVFALAALESCDGKLIAVRSARTTINTGLVYFAAGMFDDGDVHEGQLDLYGNMAREVAEETGLDLKDMIAEGSLIAFRTARFIALFQRFTAKETAMEIVSKIRSYVSAQPTPEIDEAIVISDASAVSDNMPGYMQAYCRWRFAEQITRV